VFRRHTASRYDTHKSFLFRKLRRIEPYLRSPSQGLFVYHILGN
jgi:hypothetical protein